MKIKQFEIEFSKDEGFDDLSDYLVSKAHKIRFTMTGPLFRPVLEIWEKGVKTETTIEVGECFRIFRFPDIEPPEGGDKAQ